MGLPYSKFNNYNNNNNNVRASTVSVVIAWKASSKSPWSPTNDVIEIIFRRKNMQCCLRARRIAISIDRSGLQCRGDRELTKSFLAEVEEEKSKVLVHVCEENGVVFVACPPQLGHWPQEYPACAQRGKTLLKIQKTARHGS